MLKAQFSSFGTPEKVIECVNDGNLLHPSEDEVLIDVLAFPINPADILTLEGKYAIKPSLPSKLGAECIGQVKIVGKKIKNFSEGDIVIPLDRDNWVQQKIVKEENLVHIKGNSNILQASMLKVNPATAYLMLNNYVKLSKGDWIIQNASNSAVGSYLIALAKSYGIKTINVIRRKGLDRKLKSLGADLVIPYNKLNDVESIERKNIKLAIDAVGGREVL